MKYILDTSKITPQECRDRAAGLLAQAEEYEITGEREAVTVAKAQVWATLATVPEPLEEIHGQILPEVLCPHGYTAHASLIREPGKEPQIFFTWRAGSLDGGCTQGCP